MNTPVMPLPDETGWVDLTDLPDEFVLDADYLIVHGPHTVSITLHGWGERRRYEIVGGSARDGIKTLHLRRVGSLPWPRFIVGRHRWPRRRVA